MGMWKGRGFHNLAELLTNEKFVQYFICDCVLCSRYEAYDGKTDESEDYKGREGEHH